MFKRLYHILIFTGVIPLCTFGQEIDPGPGFQMIMMNNPSLSGSEGPGSFRLSYLNFYPGNNYNFHSVYLSYDSYFPSLHGGAGIYLSDDYLGGIVNDTRGGLSYAYFLKAGKDLFINAGLSVSVFHRGFNFRDAILPDQIDALGGVSNFSSEILSNSGRTLFDVGAGFLFVSGKFIGGFSINHLSEPELSDGGTAALKLRRKLLIHLTRDVDINKSKNLKVMPLVFFEEQGGCISGGIGTSFESSYLAINAILLGNNEKNLNAQTGFSVNIGKISLYYNYRFNIASFNNLMPLSLLHETGLAFRLNNIDKRNTIHTINYPKL
jgi:type IX secretion system PorP/SprF family membrane protein